MTHREFTRTLPYFSLPTLCSFSPRLAKGWHDQWMSTHPRHAAWEWFTIMECLQDNLKEDRVVSFRVKLNCCRNLKRMSNSVIYWNAQRLPVSQRLSVRNILHNSMFGSKFVYLCVTIQNNSGAAVAQWLRCCIAIRKDASSIPVGVSGFFIDTQSFRSHYGPGFNSASKRNEYQEYFLGVKAAGA